jgi:hypothetical protein
MARLREIKTGNQFAKGLIDPACQKKLKRKMSLRRLRHPTINQSQLKSPKLLEVRTLIKKKMTEGKMKHTEEVLAK